MDLLNIYIINKNDEMLIHLLDPLTYFTCREGAFTETMNLKLYTTVLLKSEYVYMTFQVVEYRFDKFFYLEYCRFLRDLGIFGMLLKLVSSSNVVLQKHALALCLLLLNDSMYFPYD
jgi:hypothetical protein